MNLVIFDIDGTLTQTNGIDTDCFPKAVDLEFQIPVRSTNWAEYTYSTDSGILDQIFQEQTGKSPTAEEILRFKKRFVELLDVNFQQTPTLVQEIRGAQVLLEKLKQDKYYKPAIATGGWRISARWKLEKAGLITEDIPFASADDHFSREEIIRLVIEHSKQFYKQPQFEKTIYVGDGVWDLLSTRRMGIPFLGIGEDGQESLLRKEGAEYILQDYSNQQLFIELLNKIGAAKQT